MPTAIHEFGHGLVAAYGTDRTICIDLTHAPRSLGRQVGQFYVRAEPRFRIGGFCWGLPRSRRHLILILLGGPLLAAIVAGAAIFAGARLDVTALIAYGIYLAVFGGVGAIVPLPIGRQDGWLICQAIWDTCRRSSFDGTYRAAAWTPPSPCRCYGEIALSAGDQAD
jgi:hypothetical protein